MYSNVNVKRTESQGSCLQHEDCATLLPSAKNCLTHSSLFLFFPGPDTSFRKFENAFSMRKSAVSDAYGLYALNLLNSLWWKKSVHIIFDFRARVISGVSARHAMHVYAWINTLATSGASGGKTSVMGRRHWMLLVLRKTKNANTGVHRVCTIHVWGFLGSHHVRLRFALWKKFTISKLFDFFCLHEVYMVYTNFTPNLHRVHIPTRVCPGEIPGLEKCKLF